jgi:hypothetical protein
MEPKLVDNIIDWNIKFTTLVSLKSMKTFHGDWSSQRATTCVVARLLVSVFFKWFFVYKGLSKGSKNEFYIKINVIEVICKAFNEDTHRVGPPIPHIWASTNVYIIQHKVLIISPTLSIDMQNWTIWNEKLFILSLVTIVSYAI